MVRAVTDSKPLFEAANRHAEAGNLAEAEKIYRQILADFTDNGSTALASLYLGIVLRKTDRLDEALQFLVRSASMNPSVEAYSNIGPILHNRGQYDEAFKCYQNVLALKPNHVETLNNMGGLCIQAGKYDEAEATLKKSMEIRPSIAAVNYLGILFMNFGRLEEAVAQYKRGLEISPGHVSMHSNLLLAMVYAASVSPDELSQAARSFGKNIADPVIQKKEFLNHRNPDRKLRIGYVSPDFRRHAVNYFFEHLLNNHDRNNFEIYGYSCNAAEDDITQRLKGQFDHWRNLAVKTDDEAAEMIRQDQIDILVDLAGHTGNNRLLVFARKPAPVQFSWLGWPTTTGMQAMDYRITDVHAEPEGVTEHLSVEKLYRLPESFCCFNPPESSPPVISHPPFEDNGHITFGCFNNFNKITDNVLAAWSQILVQVPNSRLLLEIVGLENPSYYANIQNRLKKSNVPLDRITLIPRKKDTQFLLYNSIDIALDPFPCNGGTTSFDTLWMGVPFVTLEGNHFVSRMGVTILTNAGLPELIAKSTDEYIKIAVDLANDRERLKKLRHGLREKVSASPLMDQKRFVRNMETAYRQMWRRYVSQ